MSEEKIEFKAPEEIEGFDRPAGPHHRLAGEPPARSHGWPVALAIGLPLVAAAACLHLTLRGGWATPSAATAGRAPAAETAPAPAAPAPASAPVASLGTDSQPADPPPQAASVEPPPAFAPAPAPAAPADPPPPPAAPLPALAARIWWRGGRAATLRFLDSPLWRACAATPALAEVLRPRRWSGQPIAPAGLVPVPAAGPEPGARTEEGVLLRALLERDGSASLFGRDDETEVVYATDPGLADLAARPLGAGAGTWREGGADFQGWRNAPDSIPASAVRDGRLFLSSSSGTLRSFLAGAAEAEVAAGRTLPATQDGGLRLTGRFLDAPPRVRSLLGLPPEADPARITEVEVTVEWGADGAMARATLRPVPMPAGGARAAPASAATHVLAHLWERRPQGLTAWVEECAEGPDSGLHRDFLAGVGGLLCPRGAAPSTSAGWQFGRIARLTRAGAGSVLLAELLRRPGAPTAIADQLRCVAGLSARALPVTRAGSGWDEAVELRAPFLQEDCALLARCGELIAVGDTLDALAWIRPYLDGGEAAPDPTVVLARGRWDLGAGTAPTTPGPDAQPPGILVLRPDAVQEIAGRIVELEREVRVAPDGTWVVATRFRTGR